MSVEFARAYKRGMEAHGIRVDEYQGCYSRGNGQTSAYEGIVNHHTGSDYGTGLSVLLNGRSDLPGPLCNVCTWPDGHQTLIAAHPGNHAGASGGRSMGPLPTTRSFNKRVWGNEIMYPGAKAMTREQYRAAIIGSAVVCAILRRPNTEWARGHAETSVTGKWDPGYASGKTIDMGRFRADAMPFLRDAAPVQEDDLKEDEREALYDIRQQLCGGRASMPRPGDYSGWPTLVEGVTGSLTMVDFIRNMDKRLVRIEQLIEQHLGGGGGTQPPANP